MTRVVKKSWLFAAALVALTGGCVSGDNQDNDESSSPTKDAGKSTGKDAGKDSGKATGKDAGKDTGASTGDDDEGDDDDTAPEDDDSAAAKDSGTPAKMDGGEGKDGGTGPTADTGTGSTTKDSGSAPSGKSVEGTAEGCSSYGTPSGDKCGSYYCNVTKPDIEAALVPGGKCYLEGEDNAAEICSADVVLQTGKCARMVLESTFGSFDDEMVRDCIYADSKYEKYPDDCISCFLAVARCAGENCLVDCLLGDSPECDTCRRNANCEEPVFGCGGLPNPF